MIRLDWDKISWSKMQERINYIKSFKHPFNQIVVFSSPSLDGYHVEIKLRQPTPQKQIFQYRYDFHDDLNRLVKDMLFYQKHKHLETRDILHDFKEKTKMGVTMKFKRKQIFKYIKLRYGSEWLQIPKNSRIYIQKVLPLVRA